MTSSRRLKYRFRYSTEQLASEFSLQMMRRANAERAALEAATCAGPFKPTWSSLDSHSCPEWFRDAKFGMFLDWGLYSIAAWSRPNPHGATYPDWYCWDMYEKDQTRAYHAKHWGQQFRRDDFIPLFDASEYDPQAIVRAAADAGMKYLVPFCKHHDGFCLWDSAWTFRDAADTSPGRDLLAPLVAACREQGLKFGAYFSVEEWEYPILDAAGRVALERQWEFHPPREAAYDPARLEGRIAGKVPVRDFVWDYIVPQCKELIDRYDPDLLWYDGEWKHPSELRGTMELAAYYYNRAAGRKDVAVNDRYGDDPASRGMHGDFFTSEFSVAEAQSQTHQWEECRSIGRHFGYNRECVDADVLTPTQLVHMLADIVSRNGNLLLVVNPTGSGALLPMELARLQAVGRWLRANGEAIYATRPANGAMLLSSEACSSAQQRGHASEDGSMAPRASIRYTRSKDGRCLYAILLERPSQQVTLPGVHAAGNVTMLGDGRVLKSSHSGGALVVEIPDALLTQLPCEHAWTLRIPQVYS